MHAFPPPGWRQRVRRGLPFPPGVDDQQFEIIKDRNAGEQDWQTYHLNTSTGEVYHQVGEHWDKPPWGELPELVRTRIHESLDRGKQNAVTLNYENQ